jgi:hypothetical protein
MPSNNFLFLFWKFGVHYKKIGSNAFCLDLSPYMQMYAVVNVENLRFYEPPLIDYQGENVQISSIDDLSP